MTTELIGKLRTLGSLPSTAPIPADLEVHSTLHEAADEIIKLVTQISELKLELERIRAYASGREPVPSLSSSKDVLRAISLALGGRLSQIERLAREAIKKHR